MALKSCVCVYVSCLDVNGQMLTLFEMLRQNFFMALYRCCFNLNTVMFQHSTRAYEHPGFLLRLILDGSAIRYEPDFSEFETVFLNIYDVIIMSVGTIPRVETKLYSDWVNCCSVFEYFCYTLLT